MASTALYTDLSGYYDLMCADIDYQQQCDYVRRLHQLLGTGGRNYLDLACGTGPHLRHFIDFGYAATGLDINQPMLDIARTRCPEAQLLQQDMSSLNMHEQMDLITCFLYSIHYNPTTTALAECFQRVHSALKPGGMFCFNSVNKNTIDNRAGVKHSLIKNDSTFTFQSSWYYNGHGEQQALQLCIEKNTAGEVEVWRDQHPMVATTFSQLLQMLEPLFAVHIFEHDYQKITPWEKQSGNAFFVCEKK